MTQSLRALTAAALLTAACGEIRSLDPTDAAARTDAAADSDAGPGTDAPPADAACPLVSSVDQRLGGCQSPPITQCAAAYILHNGQSAAQAFVPGRDGVLTEVHLRMSNGAAGTNDVEVSVVEGTAPDSLSNPDFDVAGHTRATVHTSMTIAMAWQKVEFDPAPTMIAGRTYFLVVRLVGASDPGNAMALWDEYNDWQGNQVDSYTGGRAFSCGSGCASWIMEPPYRDFAFETQIGVPTCGS